MVDLSPSSSVCNEAALWSWVLSEVILLIFSKYFAQACLVAVRGLTLEHCKRDSSIYLALLIPSFTELRNWHLYFCYWCQHQLPGTAASLGRALWWVENQRGREELLIAADRQISFWRTTHSLSTPVKINLGREYFMVSLTLSRQVNKLLRLLWHSAAYVWFLSWELWGIFSLKYEQNICFPFFQYLLRSRSIHCLRIIEYPELEGTHKDRVFSILNEVF